ncbi:MAG: NAD(+) synthase [Candidatus Hydrogenedentota bacterium]
MRLVRVGVAATSMTVGDFEGNSRILGEVIATARDQGVHLLVTPELSLPGYSLEDKVFWPDLSRKSWEVLNELAPECQGIDVFIGLPIRLRSMMHNAMAFVHDGRVAGLLLKRYLPTYSIFYEGRNWAPWNGGVTEYEGVPAGDLVFALPYGVVSGEICEDMWSRRPPAQSRVQAGAEIICNASASPFVPLKNTARRRMIHNAAANLVCVYAYANMLGCDNSRVIFDGGGFISTPEGVAAEGRALAKEPWTLASAVVDLDDVARIRSENSTWRQDAVEGEPADCAHRIDLRDGPLCPAPVEDFAGQMPESFFMGTSAAPPERASAYLDELFDALVLGLRDYYEKVGVFKYFLLALSGGRDSALCLLIAVHAAKALNAGKEADRHAERIRAVYLAHDIHSSSETSEAARRLAEALGVPFRTVSISEEAEVAEAKAAEMLGGEAEVSPIARQNLQARIRGNMVLNWANSMEGLVLVTSNLSEAAVGYTTTGGDNQGGYCPIANVPKTVVTRLLEHLAEREGLDIVKEILAIPPSAELASDQRDEEDLMPYEVLDDLLHLYGRRRMALADCWRVLCHRRPSHDPELLRAWTAAFARLFAQNQWKREQLPVAMKVMELDLDPKTGFRFPVTQRIDHELEALNKAAL